MSTVIPMPMRVLSCTLDGCRNSHAANSSMMTGSAKATRPNRPPKVYASRAIATGSFGLNHSTIAPVTAMSRMRKGTPSRRSSLARVSLPSSRNAPPAMWASPSQAAASGPCSIGSPRLGSFFVGAGLPRDAFRARVRARD